MYCHTNCCWIGSYSCKLQPWRDLMNSFMYCMVCSAILLINNLSNSFKRKLWLKTATLPTACKLTELKCTQNKRVFSTIHRKCWIPGTVWPNFHWVYSVCKSACSLFPSQVHNLKLAWQASSKSSLAVPVLIRLLDWRLCRCKYMYIQLSICFCQIWPTFVCLPMEFCCSFGQIGQCYNRIAYVKVAWLTAWDKMVVSMQLLRTATTASSLKPHSVS